MGKGRGGKAKKKATAAASKGKGKKHSSSPSAATASPSCRHLPKSVDVTAFTARCDLDACSVCARDDVDLVVCATCAAELCRSHAKKHWAQAKSSHCIFVAEDGTMTCWECDVVLDAALPCLAPLFTAVTGETAAAAPSVASSVTKATTKAAKQSRQAGPRDTAGHRGLANLGNTCYFNSVVQCFAALFAAAPTLGRGALHAALTLTLHSLREGPGGKSSSNPASLLQLVRRVAPQFRGHQQQDAHELFLSLVDALRTEHRVGVARAFALESTSLVTCHQCRTTNACVERSFDLSVEVDFAPPPKGAKSRAEPASGQGDAVVCFAQGPVCSLNEPLRVCAPDVPRLLDADVPLLLDPASGGASMNRVPPASCFRATPSGLYDCRPSLPRAAGKEEALLAHFTSPESLAGPDAYHCSVCDARQASTKQILLSKLPLVLVLHLKRFKQTAAGRMVKVDSHVPFPDTLDVAPYCLPGSIVAKDGSRYRLRALVVHQGKETLRSGHYVAVVSTPQRDRWFEISDTHVTPLPSLRAALGYKAFMCFYQRQEPLAAAL